VPLAVGVEVPVGVLGEVAVWEPVSEGVTAAVPENEGEAVGVGANGTPTIMTLSLRRLPPPPEVALQQ